MVCILIVGVLALVVGVFIGYATTPSSSGPNVMVLSPPEPEAAKPAQIEVPVIGEPLKVKLYEAKKRAHYGMTTFPKWNGNVYTSCEQAHSECEGADVIAFDAIRIGSHYFRAWRVEKVQPKPKREKGKR